MGVDSATGNKRHSLRERGHDLYETPAVAVHALLKAEAVPQHIWEPACGPGAIVRVLRAAGHNVMATDLIDYDWSGQDAVLDFLQPYWTVHANAWPAIVTNPPFKHAQAFVEHALERAPLVMMLLRLAFLESERRSAILENGMLARVHVFSKRIPMMHRAGWEGRKANSGMAFAWFVWDRDHQGPTELHRLRWEPEEDLFS